MGWTRFEPEKRDSNFSHLREIERNTFFWPKATPGGSGAENEAKFQK